MLLKEIDLWLVRGFAKEALHLGGESLATSVVLVQRNR
jgi:hypothetical protein